MFVLNINVFYVCFSEKNNSTENGKTLNTLIFLFTKQRIIIIIMMCIFSSNRWTGVLHGLRITVSYQKPTVPTKFLTPVSRLQVSPTVCLDSPGAAAAITSLLKVHRLTDLERGKDDFKLSCAKLAYTDTCTIIQYVFGWAVNSKYFRLCPHNSRKTMVCTAQMPRTQ